MSFEYNKLRGLNQRKIRHTGRVRYCIGHEYSCLIEQIKRTHILYSTANQKGVRTFINRAK